MIDDNDVENHNNGDDGDHDQHTKGKTTTVSSCHQWEKGTK